MITKKTFYTEMAYAVGIILLAVGTSSMEIAGFGMSMIVAPAYILHLAVSPVLPFFTFGMAEYTFQAVLIIAMSLYLRRFRLGYLFSFVTAVIYGFVLDGAMLVFSFLPADGIPLRIIYFVVGMILCSGGVSLLFHTYISPEAYELFVKEISARHGVDIHKFKTVYDCISCAVAVMMSFVFFGFGNFVGVNVGTVVCALLNGRLIGMFTGIFEGKFEFRDRFILRHFFEK